MSFKSTSAICGKSSSAISTSRCGIFWMRCRTSRPRRPRWRFRLIGGIGHQLQFAQHELRKQQHAVEKMRLADVGDAAVDDHAGIEDLGHAPRAALAAKQAAERLQVEHVALVRARRPGRCRSSPGAGRRPETTANLPESTCAPAPGPSDTRPECPGSSPPPRRSGGASWRAAGASQTGKRTAKTASPTSAATHAAQGQTDENDSLRRRTRWRKPARTSKWSHQVPKRAPSSAEATLADFTCGKSCR